MIQVTATQDKDWYRVPWDAVWAQTKLKPTDIPGVIEPKANANKSPFYRVVHRTHLPALGLTPPASQGLTRLVSGMRIGSWEVETTPRPWQLDAIAYIDERRGTLLGDEPRVGKTLPIVASHNPDAGPLFVFGPVAARLVWHEWAARRFGECGEVGCSTCERVGVPFTKEKPSFAALKGRTVDEGFFEENPAHVYFCNFAIGFNWAMIAGLIKRIGTLVVDEAQLAGLSKRSNLMVSALRMFNPLSERVVIATGTPMWNQPSHLWVMLDILAPGAFGKYWDYAKRYCDARPSEHGMQARGASHTEELRARLGEIMLRRTWREVAGGLPPINRVVELESVSQAQHDQIAQLASDLRRLSDKPQVAAGHLQRLRRLYGHLKVPGAIRRALDELRAGNSVLIWTWHQEVADEISRLLASQACVEGYPVFAPSGLSIPAREEELQKAAACRGPRALVATMASLGVAIPLAWANHAIFAEFDWSAHTIQQTEMRFVDGVLPKSVVFIALDCDTDQRQANHILHKLSIASELNISPGVGSVAEGLSAVFGLEQRQSLDDLASLILEDV